MGLPIKFKFKEKLLLLTESPVFAETKWLDMPRSWANFWCLSTFTVLICSKSTKIYRNSISNQSNIINRWLSNIMPPWATCCQEHIHGRLKKIWQLIDLYTFKCLWGNLNVMTNFHATFEYSTSSIHIYWQTNMWTAIYPWSIEWGHNKFCQQD